LLARKSRSAAVVARPAPQVESAVNDGARCQAGGFYVLRGFQLKRHNPQVDPMTEAELAELLADCPTLYHMAERGSWAAIQRYGLLSTSALLDLYRIAGEQRIKLESRQRFESTAIARDGLPGAVLRDQKPMNDAALVRCLIDGLCPQDWYRLLNGKVFFWLTRERLCRLIEARPYRGREHDVLEVEAAPLVRAYHHAITLSPINSGATRPFARERGRGTLLSIADYPYASWRKRRVRGERVVELAVDHAVPDVTRFVSRVTAMQGRDAKTVLFCKNPELI
jgi:hypothetical protein